MKTKNPPSNANRSNVIHLDRIPHSIENEQATIGGLLLNNAQWEKVKDRLTPDDFYRPDHALIFKAISTLAAANKPFDVLTVTEWLDRNGQLREAGGSEYLGVLARDTPSTVNTAHWADIVLEKAVLRQIIAEASTTGNMDKIQDALARKRPTAEEVRFEFAKAGEMVANAKAPDWLIKDVIERNTLNHVFGDSESGKSLIEIDKACCIAAGIPWQGHKVKQGIVIYIAGEGHGGLSRRLAAWGRHHSIDMSTLPLYISKCAAPLCDAESALEVAQAIDRIVEATGQKPAYISIDTVARNFGGDENATQDMGQFISNVDIYLRTRYEAAICLVHHSGHGDKDRGRGSSVLKPAVDAEFKVCKRDGVIAVEHKRSKDGPLHEPMYFKIERVNIGLADEDGEPVDSVVIVQAEGPPTAPNTKGLGKHQKMMLDKLRALYAQAERNLADRDDAVPRVETTWWIDQCRAAGIPSNRLSEGKTQLVDRKLIRLDGLFVYLTEQGETDNA